MKPLPSGLDKIFIVRADEYQTSQINNHCLGSEDDDGGATKSNGAWRNPNFLEQEQI